MFVCTCRPMSPLGGIVDSTCVGAPRPELPGCVCVVRVVYVLSGAAVGCVCGRDASVADEGIMLSAPSATVGACKCGF